MDNTQKPDQDTSLEAKKLEIEKLRLQNEEQRLQIKKLAVEACERVVILIIAITFIHHHFDQLAEKALLAIGVWLAAMGLRWGNRR